jgi:hypothetical protein
MNASYQGIMEKINKSVSVPWNHTPRADR